MAWSLRPAEPADAEALLAVVEAGFATYRAFAPAGWEPPDELTPDRIERTRAEIADPAAFSWVAEADDAGDDVVAGVLWVPATTPSADGTTPAVHLRYLFVREPFWGTGVARELHTAAIDALRAAGHPDARLFTPDRQERARRFYERRGWRLHRTMFFEPEIGLDLVEYRLG